MLGLVYVRDFCVNCILKTHGLLNVLSSGYAKVLNLYQKSKYVMVTKGSE